MNIVPLFIAILCSATIFLNLFGLTQSIRYRFFNATPEDMFRFGREEPLPHKVAMNEIGKALSEESSVAFAGAATVLVSECLAHIEWWKLDPVKAYQTVPFWENPVLWALGRFSGLPNYQRYNFTDYRRTLERGFGVCGDASIVLSQLLDKKGIKHNIIAFPDHVLVEAELDGKLCVLDPDFGVVTKHSLAELASNSELTTQYYLDAGFPQSDATSMGKIVKKRFFAYSSVFRFVPKRYILERVSYWFFWYVPPVIVISLGLAMF